MECAGGATRYVYRDLLQQGTEGTPVVLARYEYATCSLDDGTTGTGKVGTGKRERCQSGAGRVAGTVSDAMSQLTTQAKAAENAKNAKGVGGKR